MALDPIVSGTLNQMLGGNSFVEQRDPKPSMWDHTSIPGMLGEVPMRMNWEIGKMEPVDGYPGPVHGGWGRHPRVKTMEWNYERDGFPGAGFVPIDPYNPNTDESELVPLGKSW